MDLHDFSECTLYFDETISPEAQSLLLKAADSYAEGNAESLLLKAFFKEPESLTVLVGLYRFYYYKHQFVEALEVANRLLSISGRHLKFPKDWHKVGMSDLSEGIFYSIGMVRFYLLVLKGAGYLFLRQGEYQEGVQRLEKVMELDSHDRLGVKSLIQTVKGFYYKEQNIGVIHS